MTSAAQSDGPPAVARDRRPGAGFGDFFRYHGWLAPGVRLFRRIGFPAKAALVSGAFMVPLSVLLWLMWSSTSGQMDFTRHERQGVAIVGSALDLIVAADERRRAAAAAGAGLPAAQAQVKTAYDALQAQVAAAALKTGDTEPMQALAQAHHALLGQPLADTPDQTFDAHGRFVQAVLDFVREVANRTQLMLDPELDTFHMMSMAVLRAPVQLENTARLRGMGALVLETGQLTQPRRDALVRWNAVWDLLDADVENAYQEGIERFPEVARLFDMKGTDDAAIAFREAVQAQLLGAEPSGDRARFLALADAAVGRQLQLTRQVLGRLDQRLQERLTALEWRRDSQLVVSGAFVLLAVYLVLAFYRVMMGGLQEVAGHLRAMTDGNLTTAPTPWGRDEAAELMLALGGMQRSLRHVVQTALEGSAQVQVASAEISSATEDLSQRTEQTASSLQRTAASTEQIASSVRHTAEAVAGAQRLVTDNAGAAAHGGEVVGDLVRTMEGIRGASHRIGEIIGLIDGIAFQTNILALNAAVEAARAGEHGRGFAVVATEVRALAGRSAAAAKEIKGLITASIDQVENGNRVAVEAGDAIGAIVGNAERIAALMNDIAGSTRQQSSGVGEVAAAVQELDRSTQQNAALVQQTAAATGTLSQQAERLAAEFGFFRVEAGRSGR